MYPSRSARRTWQVLPTLTDGISSLIRAYILVLPIPRYMAASSGHSHTFSAGSIKLSFNYSTSSRCLANEKGTHQHRPAEPFSVELRYSVLVREYHRQAYRVNSYDYTVYVQYTSWTLEAAPIGE
jgi:hypothetical protein